MNFATPICFGLLLAVSATGCKSKKKPVSATKQTTSMSSDVKNRIDDVIEDKVRKQRLMNNLDESESCIQNVLDIAVGVQQKMDAEAGMTRETAEGYLNEYASARSACLQTIVDNRLAMRTDMSAEEWAKVFPKDEKLVTEETGAAAPQAGETATAAAPEDSTEATE